MKKKKTPYADYAGKRAGKSKLLPDCLRAFAVGGLICAFAQCLTGLYGYIGVGEEDVKVLVIMTLIFLTAMLTGMGIFDNIARFAGAGTLVPITGFANAVVSPALDGKNEGLVLGGGTGDTLRNVGVCRVGDNLLGHWAVLNIPVDTGNLFAACKRFESCADTKDDDNGKERRDGECKSGAQCGVTVQSVQ